MPTNLLLWIAAILADFCSGRPSPPAAPIPAPSWSLATHLLAFGDSYTFVQGTTGHLGYSFISDAFNYSFTPNELLSTKIVSGSSGTSAGGPNWVEYLTGCYEGLPAKCGYRNSTSKQLWDFAFAGSDISFDLLPAHHNYTVSLVDQVKQWDLYARPYLPVKPSQGLAAIFIGINDINDSAKNTTITSFPSFYTTLQTTLLTSLAPILTAGYKNILFLNLPPLDRTPAAQIALAQGKQLYPNTTQITSWNSLLETNVAAFARDHDVKAWVFDTYSFLGDVFEHAAEYGISNTTSFCAGYADPDIERTWAKYGCSGPVGTYFWFNSGHITYRVHEILAAGVRKFLDEVVW